MSESLQIAAEVSVNMLIQQASSLSNNLTTSAIMIDEDLEKGIATGKTKQMPGTNSLEEIGEAIITHTQETALHCQSALVTHNASNAQTLYEYERSDWTKTYVAVMEANCIGFGGSSNPLIDRWFTKLFAQDWFGKDFIIDETRIPEEAQEITDYGLYALREAEDIIQKIVLLGDLFPSLNAANSISQLIQDVAIFFILPPASYVISQSVPQGADES